MYVEGGLSLTQKRAYLNKISCWTKADDIKDAYGWTKISTYELAAEIYSHAYAYYNAGALLAIAGKLGIDKAASYLTSLKKIDVENGRDSRYWAAFDVIYATL